MAIRLLPAEPSDMLRVQEIASAAFARNEPMYDLFYPLHWTPAGRAVGAERMQLIQATDPTATFLKAVDPASGEIAGVAKWHVYPGSGFPEGVRGTDEPEYWASDRERDLTAQLRVMFGNGRKEALERSEGQGIVSLDMLAVDPKWQKKGVGAVLVGWGTEKADELGVEAVVESSKIGRRLYEKMGFVWWEDVKLESEGYDGPEMLFAWMVRPKKGAK